jgi:hypothetical protein
VYSWYLPQQRDSAVQAVTHYKCVLCAWVSTRRVSCPLGLSTGLFRVSSWGDVPGPGKTPLQARAPGPSDRLAQAHTEDCYANRQAAIGRSRRG